MSKLTILPRIDWHARKPVRPRTRRDPHTINELFIHWPGAEPSTWKHVFEKQQEASSIRGIQIAHMHRPGDPFIDIGYNHVMGNGGFRESQVPRIWTARGAQYQPAAQLGHNPGTLAICVLMGPNDPLTESMIDRLRSYVRWAIDYTGHGLRVRCHGDVFSTECPGPKLRFAVRTGLLTKDIPGAKI